ncbi:MAG: DUF669 domain-containing protein [Pseudobdellovibrionaceae bacterium]
MIDFTPEEESMWRSAMSEKVNLDDGDYEGKVIKANFIRTKKGSSKLVLEYQISKPEKYSGSKYSHFLNLDSENQMYFTQKALEKLGVKVEVSLAALKEVLDREVVGEKVSFCLFTEGRFQNCNLISEDDDIDFNL